MGKEKKGYFFYNYGGEKITTREGEFLLHRCWEEVQGKSTFFFSCGNGKEENLKKKKKERRRTQERRRKRVLHLFKISLS